MDYKQALTEAISLSEKVIDIFEKGSPKDKRPRKAIEIVKECLINPSEENKKKSLLIGQEISPKLTSFLGLYLEDFTADIAYSAATISHTAYLAYNGDISLLKKITNLTNNAIFYKNQYDSGVLDER